jgi:uroporphyrinogen-III synthase
MNLSSARLLITRPRGQAETFARAVVAAGAVPVLFPVIEIGRVEDPAELEAALQALASYAWLVLTSANGVEAAWERLAALGLAGVPASVRVAAIGPKTAAALQAHGVAPAFVPAEYIAEAILPGLGDLRGRRVLLLRADLARPALAEAIRQAGGLAHEIAAYRTLPARPDPAGLEALRQGVEVITFTSASTVTNFLALARQGGLDPLQLPGSPLIACIGPITAQTARQAGLSVDAVAGTYTTEGLLEALIRYPQAARSSFEKT